MPAHRFFVDSDLVEGRSIEMEGPEYRHMAVVMRVQEGEELELINGRGQLAQASVQSAGKKRGELRVVSVETVGAPDYPIILAQAVPRANRLDTIVEKATELGVTELWLFPGERSERSKFSDNQKQRIQTQMAAAIKQCGRLHLPELKFCDPLKKWDTLPCRGYFGDVSPEAPLFLSDWEPAAGTLFVIGPEAGLTDAEEAKLRELGAHGVTLHRNILRTDTAPLVALSLLEHALASRNESSF